jgi:hypothetical protein
VLVLRAQRVSYGEAAERQGWTYTNVYVASWTPSSVRHAVSRPTMS